MIFWTLLLLENFNLNYLLLSTHTHLILDKHLCGYLN